MPALQLAQPRPLAALYNDRTRYEATLTAPDGSTAAVLAYDAKRTKRALLAAMRSNGPEIIRLTAMQEDEEFTWQGGAWRLPRGWAVAWSGYTERDRAA